MLVVYDAWGVFEVEKSSGVYRLSAYYLGALTAEAPFVLALYVCYAIACYWLTGLAQDMSSFSFFLLLLVLGVLIAQVRLFSYLL